MNIKCALCSSSNFTPLEKVNFGLWNTEYEDIRRENIESLIGECENCGHVQMMAEYTTDTFTKLYFSGEQEEVFWHEQLIGSVQPYASMVEFLSDFLSEGSVVADFGCGPGRLLTAIKLRRPDVGAVFGIDFNDRCELDGIHYISTDLNDSDKLARACGGNLLDVACASHTLEHVLDPYSFLRGLKQQLKPNGKIFIEVPDFSKELGEVIVGQCNLVNMQHIHYFTRDSLIQCGAKAGLKVDKIKQITTGYIPRLQVLFSKNDVVSISEIENQTATTMIKQIQAHGRMKRAELFNSIRCEIQKGRKIGLWGIGADFYLLLQEEQKLASVLDEETVHLFDYALADKKILGKRIRASEEIPGFDGDVYIVPSLAETRIKMNSLAQQWNKNIVDIYDTSIKQISSADPVACQVCQNSNWQSIDTLYAGKWLKQGKQIIRKELDFPIAQCGECHHVQITRPYTQELIQDLYFSTNQQPDMWCSSDSEKTPYHEMVEFFSEHLAESNSVADFGCGEGLMLKAIAEQNGDLILEGFDFNIQGEQGKIKRTSCDLNSDVSIANATHGKSFDLVLTSHVLEHVFNPLRFIKAITKNLSKKGYLFIEVPDSTVNKSGCLQFTNLVHGQHIHYYTRESLEKIANRIGFKCIKSRQFSTGIIPRLQMLFQASEGVTSNFVIQSGAKAAVASRFSAYDKSRQKLKTLLYELLDKNSHVGLWGLGGDFHLLVKNHPELTAEINDRKIILFDLELAGFEYSGQVIKSSSEIEQLAFPVVICPLYAPTRDKMHRVSRNWKTEIIDPNDY